MRPNANYYICEYESHTAVDGPHVRASAAARVVDSQHEPKDFCVMSRYALAKSGKYPLNKAGNQKLQDDLVEANAEFDMDDLLYDDAG